MNDIIALEHSLMSDLFDSRYLDDVYEYGTIFYSEASEGIKDIGSAIAGKFRSGEAIDKADRAGSNIKAGAKAIWNSKFMMTIRYVIARIINTIAGFFTKLAGKIHPKFQAEKKKGLLAGLKEAGLEIAFGYAVKAAYNYFKEIDGYGEVICKILDRYNANNDAAKANEALEKANQEHETKLAKSLEVVSEFTGKIADKVDDPNLLSNTCNEILDGIGKLPGGAAVADTARAIGDKLGEVSKDLTQKIDEIRNKPNSGNSSDDEKESSILAENYKNLKGTLSHVSTVIGGGISNFFGSFKKKESAA